MTHAPLPSVLSPAQLAEALATLPGARLLDVRTPGEYETAHIPGAYNVPVDTLAEHAREIRTVTAPVILICQSGQRARRAEDALRSAGMANLHVLDGGMNAWVAAGQPVSRGAKRLSLERQVRIVAGALAATGAFLALLANPAFAILPALIGSGLVFAGVTDRCGMAMVLAKLPYNRAATCDVPAMVRAFATAAPPVGVGRGPASAAPGGSCCAA
ncbi:MAG TPA: rhodanese-like domain-containing protein [Gemmatimonadales bacterium]|nr:rhodanese-like domain-containing protein [Gemmatimonadales bacterium]